MPVGPETLLISDAAAAPEVLAASGARLPRTDAVPPAAAVSGAGDRLAAVPAAAPSLAVGYTAATAADAYHHRLDLPLLALVDHRGRW